MIRFLVFGLFLSTFQQAALGVEVHGHRGARARFPENTLPAFDHAIQVGADVLETDMAVTKDNVVVLSHDPHINQDICVDRFGKRIKNKLAIRDLTLEQVKSFDCGTLKNRKFSRQTPVPGTRIPTLQELFDHVKSSKWPGAKTVKFNIETKIFEDHPELSPGPEEFVQRVLEVVHRNQMLSRCILQSFDPRTLLEARRMEPKLKTAYLTEGFRHNYVKEAKLYNVDIISPEYDTIDVIAVRALHKMGVEVIPWTVNKARDWNALVDMGVDAIISDDPLSLIQFLREKGLRARAR